MLLATDREKSSRACERNWFGWLDDVGRLRGAISIDEEKRKEAARGRRGERESKAYVLSRIGDVL